MTHTRYRLLSELLPSTVGPNPNIIDIGCGNGTYLAFLKQAFPNADVVGIEPSRAAAAAAPDSIRGAIRIGELLEIAPMLAPKSFDLAICSEVLEHVADPAASLRCIFSLVRPGGHFLVSVPGGMRYWSSQDVVAGHLRRFEFGEFRQLLEANGFEICRYFGWGGPFGFAYDRLVSLVGPERIMKSGDRRTARFFARALTALFRIDDLFESRWGFQLVSSATRPLS
jgi:SAM-dependent methyltransferase